MKKVNVSTRYMGRFAGKWVAIDPSREVIVAAGETLTEIAPFVTAKVGQEKKIKAFSFKVPYKDEGPYVLIFSK